MFVSSTGVSRCPSSTTRGLCRLLEPQVVVQRRGERVGRLRCSDVLDPQLTAALGVDLVDVSTAAILGVVGLDHVEIR